MLLVFAGTGTIYIQSLDERTGCRAGWIELEDGYYKCVTKSNPDGRKELCFDIYNSANTENYWCEKGKIVKIEKETPTPETAVQPSYSDTSNGIHCRNNGCL